jgi:hypothetical protein
MAKYYEREEITGTANEETLGAGIESTAEETKRIIAVWFTEITPTLQGDAILRVYLEREKLADLSYKQLLKYSGSNEKLDRPRLELVHDIPVGMRLKAGFVSSATASNFEVVYEYEII